MEFIKWVKGSSDPVFTNYRDRFNKLAREKIPVEVLAAGDWREDLIKSVWVIESEDTVALELASQATAFFVEGVGLVTCAHCLNDGGKMVLYSPLAPHKKYFTQLIKLNAAVDLAVCSHNVPSEEYQTLSIQASKPRTHGDEVYVVGWPQYAPGSDITIRRGHVDGFRMHSGIRRPCVSCGIVSGNSGGPVFDADHQLIGVAVTGADSVLESEKTAENAFIPIETLEILQI